MKAVCRAGPSLALIKYWGKRRRRANLPATPSLALTLAGLETVTTVELCEGEDQVFLAGVRQDPGRYAGFFRELRRRTGIRERFLARAENSFPTAAGLASSSSGFAALAWGCLAAAGCALRLPQVSALARVGSGSAARAVFGGWTLLPAGARSARQLYDRDHWPELRVVVVTVATGRKSISSREAMERTRQTSPYYRAWVRSSAGLLAGARDALERRDLEGLGVAMRASTLRMFATMLSAEPAILYWLPTSVAVLHECEQLRHEGVGAWETMDAGPQVKIFCLQPDLPRVVERIGRLPDVHGIMVAEAGDGPRCEVLR